MAKSVTEMMDCGKLVEMLKASVEDERKAQIEYAELADRAEFVLGFGNPESGKLVADAVQTIVTDEAKHEKFLKELLKAANEQCPTGGPGVRR